MVDQHVTIPFARGVDKRIESVLAPQGLLARVEGMRFGKDGSLQARRPFTALGVSTSDGDATIYQVAVRGESLCALLDVDSNGHATRVGEYTGDVGALAWYTESDQYYNVPSLTEVRELASPGVVTIPESLGSAAIGNLVAVAWRDTSADGSRICRFAVYDAETSRLIHAQEFAADAIETRVAAGPSSTFWVFARDSTGNDLDAYSYTPGTDSVLQSEQTGFLAGTYSLRGFDVAYSTPQSRWVFMLSTSTGLTIETHQADMSTVSATFSQAITGGTSCPQIVTLTGSFCAILYLNIATDAIDARRISIAAGSVSITHTSTDISGLSSAPASDRYVCALGVAQDYVVMCANVNTTGSLLYIEIANQTDLTTIASYFVAGVAICQAPTGVQGMDAAELYLPLILNPDAPEGAQSLGLLGCNPLHRRHYELEIGLLSAAIPGFGAGGPGHAVVTSGNRLVFSYPTNALNGVNGVRTVSAKIGGWRNLLQVGTALVVGGGAPSVWDGASCHEIGFHGIPQIGQFGTATTGSLTQLGRYSWQAIWTSQDAFGRLERSAPSFPEVYTLTGSDDLVQIFASYPQTMRGRSAFNPAVSLDLYRTVASGAVPRFEQGANVDPLDDTVSVQTFNSQSPDTSISTEVNVESVDAQGLLYTQFEIEDGAPPPGELIAYAANRVFVASRGGRLIRASKPLVPGQPIRFPGPASATAPNFDNESPEPIGALHGLDDAVYVFSARAIYVFSGQGPDTNGQGGFQPPFRLPSAGGCTNPESLVEVPQGLMCNLAGRLSLLPRGGGAPTWIGEPVRDEFDGRTVLAATTRLDGFEAVFFLDNGATLAFDVRNEQWTTGVALDLANDVVSAVEFEDRLVVVDDAGAVLREDTDFSSSGAVARTVETLDMNLGDALGWGEVLRIALLVTAYGGATVVASISFDSGLAWTAMPTRTVPASLSDGDPEVLHWTPPTRHTDRFRLRFVVTNTAGEEGARLHALRFTGRVADDNQSKVNARSFG